MSKRQRHSWEIREEMDMRRWQRMCRRGYLRNSLQNYEGAPGYEEKAADIRDLLRYMDEGQLAFEAKEWEDHIDIAMDMRDYITAKFYLEKLDKNLEEQRKARRAKKPERKNEQE